MLPGLVRPTLGNPRPTIHTTPAADRADAPVIDVAGVPIQDESAHVDRSRSPHGVLQDFDEMDLGADLARLMENDEELTEALDNMRYRETEFELTEAAATRQFMERYASEHNARLRQLESEAQESSVVATRHLSEGYKVRMKSLEAELQAHTASVVLSVQQRATQQTPV